jgi:hypothetical protein
MASLATVGREVAAGTFRCTSCGYTITSRSVRQLPMCLSCGGPNEWEALAAGGNTRSPYHNLSSGLETREES